MIKFSLVATRNATPVFWLQRLRLALLCLLLSLCRLRVSLYLVLQILHQDLPDSTEIVLLEMVCGVPPPPSREILKGLVLLPFSNPQEPEKVHRFNKSPVIVAILSIFQGGPLLFNSTVLQPDCIRGMRVSDALNRDRILGRKSAVKFRQCFFVSHKEGMDVLFCWSENHS